MPMGIVHLGTSTCPIERFDENSSAAAYLRTGIVRLGTSTCRIGRFDDNSCATAYPRTGIVRLGITTCPFPIVMFDANLSATAYPITGIVRMGNTTCPIGRFSDNTSQAAQRKLWIVGGTEPANRPRRSRGVCRCLTSSNHQRQDWDSNNVTPETM